jgi:toxin ParE1/3/4
MARIRTIWTAEAERNLEDIRRYIARDSPRTARSFTSRIIAAVRRLKDFPELGSVVEEYNDPSTREILVGVYRIIYRVERPIVRVLGIHHGAKLLGGDEPSS